VIPKNSKIIIIKIGTTSITRGSGTGGVNYKVINRLAANTHALREIGYKVIIVSSGAMGLGISKLGKKYIEEKIGSDPLKQNMTSYKQAFTSVGQVELMNAYDNIFKYYDAHVGQVLITHAGLDTTDGNQSIKNTLSKMFELDLIPVINANDTVATQELVYGDNDSLSARIAVLIGAERLIILSDIKGLFTKDPNKFQDAELIKIVKDVDEGIKNNAGESSMAGGMGGMKSKILATEICLRQNIPVDIISASNMDQIPFMVCKTQDEILGTRFLVS
jgi:glutamate 5-kinase